MKTRIIVCFVLSAIALPVTSLSREENFSPSPPESSKRFVDLAPHPRLYVSQEQIQRMVAGRGADYSNAYEKVEAAAETAIRDFENPMDGISVWSRGVLNQGRLLSLAVQWHRTRDRRYLDAALKNIDSMKEWMKTGSITLATGQFIAGFAITYDLLYNDLTEQERAWMVDVGRTYYAESFMNATGPSEKELRREGEHRSWWQNALSNWNPVSIAGGGMLALTMYEDLPEAQTMIDRLNESLEPIFEYLPTTEGGWMEGLGYWNWTMHYISLFGISYERATGEKHAGFRSEGFRQTLSFGTYFVPHGEACGFGDNNHGGFSDSLLAAAEHLGYTNTLARLQDHRVRMKAARELKEQKRASMADYDVDEPPKDAAEGEEVVNTGYGPPQSLLIEPEPLEKGIEPQENMVKHYPIQGWSMLADQWPRPTIFAIARGGELGGAHTHEDLLSWQAVVGIEKMIRECGNGRSSSAAFGPRDKEIFERGSHAKNTLFIGGIPPDRVRNGKPKADTETFQLPTGPAVRLDASRAFYLGSGNPRRVVRLYAVIGSKGLLVLDRVVGRAGNPVEVRAYTQKDAIFNETDVLLKGEFETARMTFACDQPAVLRRAASLTTLGSEEQLTMMRWQTLDKVKDVTMATLLTRGEEPVDLQVQSADTSIIVKMKGADWTEEVQFTSNLEVMTTQE